MLKKLIINADDLGLTKAVSDAIFEIFENGSLTSATLMVNMPGSAYAAEKSKKYSKLGIGLHANFTEGKPLLPNQNLTDSEGDFIGRKDLFKRKLLFKITQVDIQKELSAQYDKLFSLGINPTHIDSHEHVHILPCIFPVFADFARSKNLPLRVTYPQILFRNGYKPNATKLSKQLALKLIVKTDLLTNKQFKRPDSFNSVFDIHPYEAPVPNDFKMLIQQAKGVVHELMVHPYILSAELKEVYNTGFYETKTDFFQKAVNEYECLKKINIRSWLGKDLPQVQLINYSAIE
jgi:chitin disaccharide deacetylase